MNMRINQQSLEVFLSEVGKSRDTGVKQVKGSFGKLLAGAVKAVHKQDSRQITLEPERSLGNLMNKSNTLHAVPNAVNPRGRESIKSGSVATDQVQATQIEQDGDSAPNEKAAPEPGYIGDGGNWWLELLCLMNFFAQLSQSAEAEVAGTGEAEGQLPIVELQAAGFQAAAEAAKGQMPVSGTGELVGQVNGNLFAGTELAEPTSNEKAISRTQGLGILVPGPQLPETELTAQQLSGGTAASQEAGVPDTGQSLTLKGSFALENALDNLQGQSQPASGELSAVSVQAVDQLNQRDGQVDTLLVPVKEKANQTGLEKLAAKLKPLLDQLLQGKVTVTAAAEAILGNPGLMEELTLQVKLLQLKQPADGQAEEGSPVALENPHLQEANDQSLKRERVLVPGGSGSKNPIVPEGVAKQPAAKEQLGMAANGSSVESTGKGEEISKTVFPKPDEERKEPGLQALPGSDGENKVHREFSSPGLKGDAGLKGLAETNIRFNEPEQQPWFSQPGLNDHEQSPEAIARTFKAQTGNTARELATHLIFKQIVNHSQLTVGKDYSEIRIQLRPEFLGKVSLEIAVEQGIVKAEIAAENQQVKQLIEANLGNLKQTLTNQGLRVDQLVVNLGQGQSQFGQAKGQGGGQSGRSTRRGQDVEGIFEVGEITGEYGGHLAGGTRVVDYKV